MVIGLIPKSIGGRSDGSFDAVGHLAYLQAQGLPEDSFLDDADSVFPGAFGFAGLGVRVGDHQDVEFLGNAFGYLEAVFGGELQGESAGDGLAVPRAFVGAGEADALSGQAIPREGDDGGRWGRLLGAADAGGGDGYVEVVGGEPEQLSDGAEVAAFGGGDYAVGERGNGEFIEVVAVDVADARGSDGPFLREVDKGVAFGFGDLAVFEDAGEEGCVLEEGGVVGVGDGVRDHAGNKPLQVGRGFGGALAGGAPADGGGLGTSDSGPGDRREAEEIGDLQRGVGQKAGEQGGRGAAIVQGGVRLSGEGDVVLLTNHGELAAASEAHGAERGDGGEGVAEAFEFGFQEAMIEGDVVTGDGGAAGEGFGDESGDVGKAGGVAEVGGGEPVDVGGADVALGIEEGDELAEDGSVGVDDHDGEFHDAVAVAGAEAGGLHIDDGDGCGAGWRRSVFVGIYWLVDGQGNGLLRRGYSGSCGSW